MLRGWGVVYYVGLFYYVRDFVFFFKIIEEFYICLIIFVVYNVVNRRNGVKKWRLGD